MKIVLPKDNIEKYDLKISDVIDTPGVYKDEENYYLIFDDRQVIIVGIVGSKTEMILYDCSNNPSEYDCIKHSIVRATSLQATLTIA